MEVLKIEHEGKKKGLSKRNDLIKLRAYKVVHCLFLLLAIIISQHTAR